MSPKEFESLKDQRLAKAFEDYQKKKPNIKFHRWIFEESAEIGRGGFGEVRDIGGHVAHTVIKLVPSPTGVKKLAAINEVKILRAACKQTEEDYAKLSDCKSTAITHFYGCVDELHEVYQFQELMSRNLNSEEARSEFDLLPADKKIEAMLEIMDKVIELHGLRIVHGDLKPENIMTKEKSFSDFRLIDLGLSNFNDMKFLGGTNGYLPPERYGVRKFNTGLAFTDDVFALGVTFAELAGGFEVAYSELRNKCLEDPEKKENCRNVIVQGLEAAFTEEKGLKSILEAMKKSLQLAPASRYQTMKEFSIDLIAEFEKLEASTQTISKIVNSNQKFDEESATPSFWRHYLVTKHRTLQQGEKNQENEPNDRIPSLTSEVFGSSSARKDASGDEDDEERGERKDGSMNNKDSALANRLDGNILIL